MSIPHPHSHSYQPTRESYMQRDVPIMSTQTQKLFTDIYALHPRHSYAEIGTAVGYGTRFVAKMMQRNENENKTQHYPHKYNKKIYTIDTREVSIPIYHESLQYRQSIQKEQFPTIHCTQFPYSFCAETIHHSGRRNQYDAVFIDGRKVSYGEYLSIVSPYLCQNALCICDDILSQKKKMGGLYTFLEKMQWNRQIIDTKDNDAVLITGPNREYMITLFQQLQSSRSFLCIPIV